jgi:geranylgeranyl diphosphate synthase type II
LKDFVKETLQNYIGQVEKRMETYLKCENTCAYKTIYDAVKYSAFAGGKRLRPVLMLEFCRISGGRIEDALPFACALEMIHTYSLIHDDLPAMDDDDYRRGKLTNHKVFGEGIAVLAGDALLNRAFETALQAGKETSLSPEQILQAMKYLADCAGMDGMIGGQVLDLEGEHRALDQKELEQLQSLKTGKLIEAAVVIGCIAAGKGEPFLSQARKYAQCVGLAFQIQDDILDVEGDEALLGKPIGSDAENEKSTFPKLLGMAACKEKVQSLTQQAVEALQVWEDTQFLRELTVELASRDH